MLSGSTVNSISSDDGISFNALVIDVDASAILFFKVLVHSGSKPELDTEPDCVFENGALKEASVGVENRVPAELGRQWRLEK